MIARDLHDDMFMRPRAASLSSRDVHDDKLMRPRAASLSPLTQPSLSLSPPLQLVVCLHAVHPALACQVHRRARSEQLLAVLLSVALLVHFEKDNLGTESDDI